MLIRGDVGVDQGMVGVGYGRISRLGVLVGRRASHDV